MESVASGRGGLQGSPSPLSEAGRSNPAAERPRKSPSNPSGSACWIQFRIVCEDGSNSLARSGLRPARRDAKGLDSCAYRVEPTLMGVGSPSPRSAPFWCAAVRSSAAAARSHPVATSSGTSSKPDPVLALGARQRDHGHYQRNVNQSESVELRTRQGLERLPEREAQFVVLSVRRGSTVERIAMRLSRRPRRPVSPPNPDMEDELVDRPTDLIWRDAIDFCSRLLHPLFREADQTAMRYQTLYRLSSATGSTLGAATVLLLAFSLAGLIVALWIRVGGAVAAVLAAASGMAAISQQRRWILERHKAERCRMLKFRFLADTSIWSADPDRMPRRRADLILAAKTARSVTRSFLNYWIEDDLPTAPPEEGPKVQPSPQVLHAVVEFYVRKRLRPQMHYFLERLRRHDRFERHSRSAPGALLIMGTAAAALHFATGRPEIGLFAVGFFVAHVAVRSIQQSRQAARNSVRYRIKYVVLRRMELQLRADRDPLQVARDFWCCEEVFESEHREWLRLMLGESRFA